MQDVTQFCVMLRELDRKKKNMFVCGNICSCKVCQSCCLLNCMTFTF